MYFVFIDSCTIYIHDNCDLHVSSTPGWHRCSNNWSHGAMPRASHGWMRGPAACCLWHWKVQAAELWRISYGFYMFLIAFCQVDHGRSKLFLKINIYR